jgi:hypothetical protein
MSCCVSLTEVTTAAGWLAGLAVVALLATGWRKPARARVDSSRRDDLNAHFTAERPRFEEAPASLYRPAPWWRRVWSLVWGGALAVWVGAVFATLIGFGVADAVITLTDLLKR